VAALHRTVSKLGKPVTSKSSR